MQAPVSASSILNTPRGREGGDVTLEKSRYSSVLLPSFLCQGLSWLHFFALSHRIFYMRPWACLHYDVPVLSISVPVLPHSMPVTNPPPTFLFILFSCVSQTPICPTRHIPNIPSKVLPQISKHAFHSPVCLLYCGSIENSLSLLFYKTSLSVFWPGGFFNVLCHKQYFHVLFYSNSLTTGVSFGSSSILVAPRGT
jgi:hypothetical protein